MYIWHEKAIKREYKRFLTLQGGVVYYHPSSLNAVRNAGSSGTDMGIVSGLDTCVELWYYSLPLL